MSGPGKPRHDPGAPFAGLRLRSLSLFLLVQSVVQAALVVVFFASSENVGGPDQPLYAAPSLESIDDILSDLRSLLFLGSLLLCVLACQLVFIWPVRRPSFKNDRGWPLRLSLAVGGLAVGALAFAAVAAISGFFAEVLEFRLPDLPDGAGWPLVAAIVGVPWVLTTILLWKFSRRADREGFLSRFAARLFLGTMIEVAAIIPLDAMIRRKTDCYCFAGSFIALCICGAVGFFAAGPAVLLPLLARRRKRWYAGRCDACGYDMAALANAERCPECGAGWRPATAP